MSTTKKLTTHWPSITPTAVSIPVTQSTASNYTIQGITGPFWNNTLNVSERAGTIQIKGTADIEGDIVLKGKSLSETLEKIQERLNILVPNKELEAEYAELAALRRRYVELERELQEKQRVFDILKKQ